MAPSRPPGPNDLKLFEEWMNSTRWLLERTQRFPKTLRHSLTQRVEAAALDVLEHTTTAAYVRHKRPALEQANDALNRLRVLLRLAHELGVLPHAQYEEAAKRMASAGQLLGGWMRQQAKPTDPHHAD